MLSAEEISLLMNLLREKYGADCFVGLQVRLAAMLVAAKEAAKDA